MNVLVLNAGSSSLKFQLFRVRPNDSDDDWAQPLAGGMIDRYGDAAELALELPGEPAYRGTAPVPGTSAAIERVLGWLERPPAGPAPLAEGLAAIDAVGHRVVHGGEHFRGSVLIDSGVLRRIAEISPLAPLHNPHNLEGIRAAREALGEGVPQAVVFDTAFHHTLPEHAYLYAIPRELYRRHGVRRYGFHGTSHRYVTERYARLTGRAVGEVSLVSLHLGNGCSACAVRSGRSVDTSMGFTPLEGLVMGTRSGDLDPAVVEHLATEEGLKGAEVVELLNRRSGLLGLSGISNDVRDLLAARARGDAEAELALRLFAYRARKYVGAYLAALGGAEAVVFTGGIGENASEVRSLICEGLEWMGLALDPAANAAAVGGREGPVGRPGTRLAAWVIPTDEERLIARDTARLVSVEC